MTPRTVTYDDRQLELSPSMHWHKQGGRIREILTRAAEANGLSHEWLEQQTGIDAKQIGRSLRNDAGAHLPAALIACLMWNDRLGIIVTGLAGLVGYDATPKKPDLSAEVRMLRDALQVAMEALQKAANR